MDSLQQVASVLFEGRRKLQWRVKIGSNKRKFDKYTWRLDRCWQKAFSEEMERTKSETKDRMRVAQVSITPCLRRLIPKHNLYFIVCCMSVHLECRWGSLCVVLSCGIFKWVSLFWIMVNFEGSKQGWCSFHLWQPTILFLFLCFWDSLHLFSTLVSACCSLKQFPLLPYYLKLVSEPQLSIFEIV